MPHDMNPLKLILFACILCMNFGTHSKILEHNKDKKHPQPIVPLSVKAASNWNYKQTHFNSNQYIIFPSNDDNYYSSNPKYGWQIHFSTDGTTTLSPFDDNVAADYHLDLKLSAIGYGTLIPLQHPQQISSQDNTIIFNWNDILTERWVNTETDLEQWFYLTKRPVHSSNEKLLTLKLTVDSTLSAKQVGENILFSNTFGTNIYYNKLKVWDITGRQLPAKFLLDAQSIYISINDKNAQYLITIDPSFQQQSYVKPLENVGIYIPGSNAEFGNSIAIDDNTMVVGAWYEPGITTEVKDDQNLYTVVTRVGAAYVFIRDGHTWKQQAYLKVSNTDTLSFRGNLFGTSVAIDGDTIVVGAFHESSNATGVNGYQNNTKAYQAGAAYVFIRNGTNWTQQAYLKASNTQREDLFGTSVAISGDTIIIGAPKEDSKSTGINGDQHDNSIPNSGAAYVYIREDNTWSQQAYLKASNTGLNDEFGRSVAISDNTVVVGAWREASNATGVNGDQSDNSAGNRSDGAGAAYIFIRNGNSWSQQAYLKTTNPLSGVISNDKRDGGFGSSVAIAGDTVVIGTPNEEGNSTVVDGVVNDDSAVNLTHAGAAYVFNRNGSQWGPQAQLKASNSGGFDRFGSSIAIDDNTVVIGAPNKKSRSTAVVANQNDISSIRILGDRHGDGAGAAYVFSRNGSDWRQRAYLTASNPDAGDDFGRSVSISGDTVVVGASGEDSNATGINGNQNDNSSIDRYYLSSPGAAYVFSTSSQQKLANKGLWWNPSKPGSGFAIDINSNNDLTMIWYTYTFDGYPIWHLASAPISSNNWQADLFEFSWNGDIANSNQVGSVKISFHDSTHATLTWTLNTNNGSENMEFYAFNQDSKTSIGTWYDASQPGFGLTQVNQGSTQVRIFYFYDQSGNPTWVMGSNLSSMVTTEMDTYTGSCPACLFKNPVATPAGTVTAKFSDPGNETLSTDINLSLPLSGSWQMIDAKISNLSE